MYEWWVMVSMMVFDMLQWLRSEQRKMALLRQGCDAILEHFWDGLEILES